MMSSRSNSTAHNFAPPNKPIVSPKSQRLMSVASETSSIFVEFTSTMEAISAHPSGRRTHSADEDLQSDLDQLTGKIPRLCSELCDQRAKHRGDLKVKIDALLYLLPEDADTERGLLWSLIADLEHISTERCTGLWGCLT